jgi:hypothetical protein
VKTDTQVNEEILSGQREQARRQGSCASAKSFSLRSQGTALVVCGDSQADHIGDHSRVDYLSDGSTITFRWAR